MGQRPQPENAGLQRPKNKNAQMVGLRATKFDMLTHMAEYHASMGSATPLYQGDGPQRLQNFWDLLYARTQ